MHAKGMLTHCRLSQCNEQCQLCFGIWALVTPQDGITTHADGVPINDDLAMLAPAALAGLSLGDHGCTPKVILEGIKGRHSCKS